MCWSTFPLRDVPLGGCAVAQVAWFTGAHALVPGTAALIRMWWLLPGAWEYQRDEELVELGE